MYEWSITENPQVMWKNKMRLNEVFEPIVKYPYAVLQCNGLLDE